MFIVESGYDFWNPIMWIIAFIVVMIVAYIFRSRGQKNYKKDTEQTKIFLCGEEVPEAEQRHVRGSNVYWGFFEALKGYYSGVVKPHTGVVNDYVLSFIAIMAVSAIIIFIAGQV